jgi:hypothetical protein
MFLYDILAVINGKKNKRAKKIMELRKFLMYVENLFCSNKISGLEYSDMVREINISIEFALVNNHL